LAVILAGFQKKPAKTFHLNLYVTLINQKLAARKMQAFNLEIWAEAVSYMAQ
jgi:hypothetical protein